jgi:hypothetical protein
MDGITVSLNIYRFESKFVLISDFQTLVKRKDVQVFI